MTRLFTSADEGKAVVTAGGDVIGHVQRVRDGAAYVRPRSGLVRGLGSWLASPWNDDAAYRLDDRLVDRITGTAVRLRADVARRRPGRRLSP